MGEVDPPIEETLAAHAHVPFRVGLPLPKVPSQDRKQPSILTVIKGAIGKNLKDPIPMPVELHEPTTSLMKRAEDLEYSALLDQAASLPKSSIDRLLKVAAFALSPYSSCHPQRTEYPFSSLPGETLELVIPKKGVRFIAECIYDEGWNHAYYAEGKQWTLKSDDQPQPKIHANSVEFDLNWSLELTFKDGDVYFWKKATSMGNNVVTGPLFVSHHGRIDVRNKDGKQAVISFTDIPALTFTTKARKQANRPVSGSVFENGQKRDDIALKGFWDSKLEAHYRDGVTKVLWEANQVPKESARVQMTDFVISISQLSEEQKNDVLATDSRLRKDVKFVRESQWREAQLAKVSVEDKAFKQVAFSRQNKGNLIPAKWFSRNKDWTDQGSKFQYCGHYWATKQSNTDSKLTNYFLEN